MHIRNAEPRDIAPIIQLIRDLAEYEKALDEVRVTEGMLTETIFGASPSVFAHVVEHESETGVEIAGFAIWFLSYSTWLGQNGIYLEDLYVRPEFRGLGYGKALLEELAGLCLERNYGRLEWSCLDWNTPSIGFYKSLGAESKDDWTGYRLTGDALQAMASSGR